MAYARKYVSLALLIIVALSILPVIALTPMRAKAASTVSITTSRDAWGTVYKNEKFYVDVNIVPPPSTTNVTLLVTVGSSTYTVNATRIGLSATYRANFTIDSSGNLKWVYKTNSISLTALMDGDTITFSYGGETTSIIFAHKAASLSVRDPIPAYYAKLTGTADWRITAPDLNSNPYAKDSFTVPSLTISVYDPYKGTTVTKTLTNIPFVETDVNTGVFEPNIANITAYTNTTIMKASATIGSPVTLQFINAATPVNITFSTNLTVKTSGNETEVKIYVPKLNITNNNINTVLSFNIVKKIDNIINNTYKSCTAVYTYPVSQKVNSTKTENLEDALKVYLSFDINVTRITSTKTYYVSIKNVKVQLNALEFYYYWVNAIFAPADSITVTASVPTYLGSSESDSVSASAKPVQKTSEISAKASLSDGIEINVTNPLFNVRNYTVDYVYAVVYIGIDKVPKIIKLKESDVNTGLFQGTIPASTLWNELTAGNISGTIANISITVYDPMIIWNSATSNWQTTWVATEKTIYISYCEAKIEDVSPSQVVLGKSLVTFTLVDGDLKTPTPISFSAGDLAAKNVVVSGKVFGRLILEAVVENVTSGETYPVLMEAKSSYTIILTQIDTGKFSVGIDLSKFNLSRALAADEKPVKLEIIYEDEFTPSYEAKNISTTIPVLTPSISVDRDYIPLTKVGNPIVKVTIVDPESNKNPYLPDVLAGTLKVYLVYYNNTAKDITTSAVSSLSSIMETGADTSTFVFNVTVPTSDIVPGLIGGYLEIKYTTPASGAVMTKEIPFKLYDVKLYVNGSSSISVKYGQYINITVVEPDANLYNSGVETYTGAKLGLSGSTLIASTLFNETGPDTGIFTAIIPVNSTLGGPGSEITLKLTDATSTSTVAGDTAWYSTEVTATITITVSKASLEAPTEHGPYGIVEIKVTDPDMNKNPTAKDTVKLYIYLNNMPAPRVSQVNAVETDVDTGVFVYDLNLSKLGSPANLIGSTITVMYIDQYNPSGAPETISKNIKIISWDGKVCLDKKYYDLGEPINITVVDPDANSNPNKVETVWVLVTSSATPITKNITLYETGPDTGVFSNVIRTTDDFTQAQQAKYIYAKYGDTVTVKYYDRYPADYASTQEGKWFEATATIGVPVEKPIKPSQPEIVDMNGQPTTPKVGKTIIVKYNLTNSGYETETFTVLFIVRNAQGVPIVIQVQQVTLPAGATQSIGFGFIPQAAGSYTVEIHVIKSLSQPETLGEQVTQQITVTQ